MHRRLAIGLGLVTSATLVTTIAVGALAIGVGSVSTSPVGAAPPGGLSAGGASPGTWPPGPAVQPMPVAQGDGGGLPWASAGAIPAGWRTAFAWHVPVLMYHLIAPPGQAGHAIPGLVISPTLFRDQLRTAWRAGWRTITASQLAEDMAVGAQPPPRSFVITIDDGNEDGWTEAYPILRAFDFVATYFVPTGRIGHPGDLSVAQVAALSQAGMEIANHTVNHVPLGRVAPAEASLQIDDAQAALAGLLGAPPVTMAYPFGNRDLRVIEDAAASGIDLAFTTVEGCSETLGARLNEPRLRVTPWTTPTGLLGELGRCAAMPAWG